MLLGKLHSIAARLLLLFSRSPIFEREPGFSRLTTFLGNPGNFHPPMKTNRSQAWLRSILLVSLCLLATAARSQVGYTPDQTILNGGTNACQAATTNDYTGVSANYIDVRGQKVVALEFNFAGSGAGTGN